MAHITVIALTDPEWRAAAQQKFPPLTVGKLMELLSKEDPNDVVLIHDEMRYAVHPLFPGDNLAAATQVNGYGTGHIIIGSDDGNY